MASIAAALSAIKSDALGCLGGAAFVNDCFARAGHVWRDRVLDPAGTLALFVLQILHGNTAIGHLRHLCGGGGGGGGGGGRVTTVSNSSYCEARARLPLAGVAELVERVCCECHRCMESAAWLGRRVLMADGTGTLTPDAPALQAAWPQSSEQRPGCGFPAIKLLGLLDLATGMIVHLTVMRLRVQEFSQLAGPHAALRGGDVLLADRGFCSFWHLAMLAARAVDAVFRMHQRQLVDFTPGRACGGGGGPGQPRSRFIRRLGHEDQIVEWQRPPVRPTWMTPEQFAAMPAALRVRELRYRVAARRGYRTRVVTVATTLLEATRYPKREIARLYGLRWEIETDFRHLKTTLRMEHLKCRSVDGVRKELMIYVLVYNLVRAAMTAAAARQRVADANRISFSDALRWLCARLVTGGSNRTAEPPALIVNPPRTGRWCPRVKKKRMKEFDLMTKPRADYAEPQPDAGDRS
jgi:hypothetical protein